MESVKIFGVTVHNTTLDDTTKLLEECLKENTLKVIYTPNTEIIMAAKGNNELRELINKGDFILPDGIGLIYGSRIKKKPLKERVTGFDTSMRLLDIGNKYSYSIYLLGGKDGIAKEAAKQQVIDGFMVFIDEIEKNDVEETSQGFDEKAMMNAILSVMNGDGGHLG